MKILASANECEPGTSKCMGNTHQTCSESGTFNTQPCQKCISKMISNSNYGICIKANQHIEIGDILCDIPEAPNIIVAVHTETGNIADISINMHVICDSKENCNDLKDLCSSCNGSKKCIEPRNNDTFDNSFIEVSCKNNKYVVKQLCANNQCNDGCSQFNTIIN